MTEVLGSATAEPTAEVDRGRHYGIAWHTVVEGGPGNLAERSATEHPFALGGMNHEITIKRDGDNSAARPIRPGPAVSERVGLVQWLAAHVPGNG